MSRVTRPLSPMQALKGGRAVAAVSKAELLASTRNYRDQLRKIGFSPAEIRLFAAAAAGAVAGPAATRCFDAALESGRQLALLDIPRSRVVLAFDALHTSFQGKADPGAVSALLYAAMEGHTSVLEAEKALFDGMIQAAVNAKDVGSILQACKEQIGRYFSAAHARLYEINIDDDSDVTGRLSRTAFIGKRSHPLLLQHDWPAHCNSFWSIPLATSHHYLWLIQLAFNTRRPMLPRDRRTLDGIVLRCVLALERLVAERQFRERSLRVFDAEELERRRISRRLHDDPAQSLAVVRLQLEMIEGSLPESVRPQVMEARGHIEKTIEVVRGLISDLSPVVLEKLGIEAAIRQLVTRFKQSYPAKISLTLNELPPVNRQISLVLYRALQECFTNITRHSSAQNINVSVSTADKVLRLHVEDDGIGFQVKDGLSRQDCFGLVGIRERITLLGGYLSIRSTPKSGGKSNRSSRSGTEISIELPLPTENPS